MWPGGPAAVLAAAAGDSGPAEVVAGGDWAAGGMVSADPVAADGPGQHVDTFPDEVLRTTADLGAILALAGVTGAGVGGSPDGFVVPDTLEGVEVPRAVAAGARAVPGGGLPILGEDAASNVDAPIIAGRRSI
jgi:hypothetical protein